MTTPDPGPVPDDEPAPEYLSPLDHAAALPGTLGLLHAYAIRDQPAINRHVADCGRDPVATTATVLALLDLADALGRATHGEQWPSVLASAQRRVTGFGGSN